jgi:hypothetical protein
VISQFIRRTTLPGRPAFTLVSRIDPEISATTRQIHPHHARIAGPLLARLSVTAI